MRIVAIYLALAATWIIGSDWLAGVVSGGDRRLEQYLQTYKGLFFVTAMAGLLYALILRLQRAEEERRQMEEIMRITERLDGLGSLAASVVHDFNNMITVIRGQAMLARGDPAAGEAMRQRLDQILAAATHASDVAGRLSLFIRRTPQCFTALDPGVVLRGFEPLLRQGATKRVELELEIADRLPLVSLDRAQFEAALLNLVVNARDALRDQDDARVRIVVQAVTLDGHRSVFQARAVSGRFVRIDCIDNGPGIARGHVTRIFQPFYTTKPAGQGTGLGLPSVLRTCQQHGGWVELESEPGQGATFRLFLPTAAESAAPLFAA